MNRVIINFVLFQLGWFACVLGAAWQMPVSGTLLASLIVIYHLYANPPRANEVILIVLAVLLGTTWDSWLVIQGWLSFNSGMLHPFLAPYWIIMLWALFATTINISLAWLKQRYLLAALLGAIAGPAAYYAGTRLGAVELIQPQQALLALALGWSLWLPLLLFLSGRIERIGNNLRQREFG